MGRYSVVKVYAQREAQLASLIAKEVGVSLNTHVLVKAVYETFQKTPVGSLFTLPYEEGVSDVMLDKLTEDSLKKGGHWAVFQTGLRRLRENGISDGDLGGMLQMDLETAGGHELGRVHSTLNSSYKMK